MSILQDNLPAGIAALTAALGLVGAWLKLKPRRFIGWFTAVKERETLLAMLEHEQAWGHYWKTQAQECIAQFQKEYRAEAIADAQADVDRASASPGGGGRRSSGGADGPTQKERLTG